LSFNPAVTFTHARVVKLGNAQYTLATNSNSTRSTLCVRQKVDRLFPLSTKLNMCRIRLCRQCVLTGDNKSNSAFGGNFDRFSDYCVIVHVTRAVISTLLRPAQHPVSRPARSLASATPPSAAATIIVETAATIVRR